METLSHFSDDEQEEWRPVIGYEGVYDVSSLGRVRRAVGGKGARKGVVLTLQANRARYLTVSLWQNNQRKVFFVHALVAEAFIGARASGLEVNHRDGDKTNNRPRNLEYVTRRENARHYVDVLGGRLGERHSHAKLTDDQVREIRAMRRLRQSDIDAFAERFHVSPHTVKRIGVGVGWKHIPYQPRRRRS